MKYSYKKYYKLLHFYFFWKFCHKKRLFIYEKVYIFYIIKQNDTTTSRFFTIK